MGSVGGRPIIFIRADSVARGATICRQDSGNARIFECFGETAEQIVRRVRGAFAAAHELGIAKMIVAVPEGERELLDGLRSACADVVAGGNASGAEVDVVEVSRAYVAGEETALLAGLEGKPPKPRMRPPFPATQGLWGWPTLVQNVETLAVIGVLRFFAAETAEQCPPCYRGLPKMADLLQQVEDGDSCEQSVDEVREFMGTMSGRNLCSLPDGAATIALSYLRNFSDDLELHVRSGCPHG